MISEKAIRYFISFSAGALLLSFFSFFQKRLLGITEVSFAPKAFVIPVLFGGFAGLAIAIANARLRESHAQLEDYLNHIDDLVQIVSRDQRFLYVNQAWRDALQYSPEEIKHLKLVDILLPEKADACMQLFERIFRGEQIGEIESVFVAKDGSKIYVRGSSNVGCTKEGADRTRGIFRNITADIEAQEFRRLSAKIFEYAKDGLLVLDVNRKIMMSNPAFLEMSGYDAKELLGMDAKELFLREKYAVKISPQIRAALEKEKSWRGEIIAYKKDGTPYPCKVLVNTVDSLRDETDCYICLIRDISQEKKHEAELQRLAWYDHLTQLSNRSHFDRFLMDLLETAQENKSYFALFFMDLDGFKKINDQHGHAMGDLLLRAFAKRLQSNIREGDLVARIGGDEFGIVLRNIEQKEQVCAIAQKIVRQVSAPYHINGTQLRVGVSIGISTYPTFQTFDALLNQADSAMYAAKKDPAERIKFAPVASPLKS